MAYLVTIADMSSHLYDEYMDEITRNTDAIVQTAIDRAISQAKGYLSRFDLPKLFGTVSTNPTITDPQLKGIVKDLALWHLIQLSNPNIEMSRAQAAYEYAVSWLKDVQRGLVSPEGWPYADATAIATPPEGTDVSWSSNTRRTNHW